MQRWEIRTMLAGIILLAGNVVFFGVPVLNFVGAAMVLFPPVLFLVRYVEGFWRSSPET